MAEIKGFTITFNIEDPEQREMWEYVRKRTNKSAYGKLLIYKDMKREVTGSNPTHDIENEYLKNLI